MSIDLLWLLTLLLSKLTINKEYKKELKQLLGISSSPLRLQISDFFNLLSKHIKKNKKNKKWQNIFKLITIYHTVQSERTTTSSAPLYSILMVNFEQTASCILCFIAIVFILFF